MANRQYIGARYVPQFYVNSDGTSAWRSGVAYEALTIVTYNNNTYTSKIPVPASVGNPSDNPTYWVSTGVFNAQLEEVSNRLASYIESNDAENIENLGTIHNRKFLFIMDSYGQGPTIQVGKRVAGFLGLVEGTNYFESVHGGYGFAATAGTFTQLLSASADIVTIDPDLITDIVVLGGSNDVDAGTSAISTGISGFSTLAKSMYPNATVHIGMIGAITGKNMSNVTRAYTFCCGEHDNTEYFFGSENINRNPAQRSDGTHPDSDMARNIAVYIASSLQRNNAINCIFENVPIDASVNADYTTSSTPQITRSIHGNVTTIRQLRDLFNVQMPANNTICNGSVLLNCFTFAGWMDGISNYNVANVPCRIQDRNGNYHAGTAIIEFIGANMYIRPVAYDSSGNFATLDIARIDVPRFTLVTDTIKI